MKNPSALNLIESATKQFEAQYQLYQRALVGLLATSVRGDSSLMRAARINFLTETETLASNTKEAMFSRVGFPSVVWALVDQAIEDSASDIASDTHDAIVESATMVISDLEKSVEDSLHIDAARVLHRFRQFQTDATFWVLVKRTSTSYAVIKSGMKALENIEFRRVDASGRNILTVLSSYYDVRQALLRVYIDTYLYALAAEGVTVAALDPSDSRDERDGLVFTFGTEPQPSIPTYEDMVRDVWHPNSTILVRRAA